MERPGGIFAHTPLRHVSENEVRRNEHRNNWEELPPGYWRAFDVPRCVWIFVRPNRVTSVHLFDPRPLCVDLGSTELGPEDFRGPENTCRLQPLWGHLDNQHYNRVNDNPILEDELLVAPPRSHTEAWHYIDICQGLIVDAIQLEPARKAIGNRKFPAWGEVLGKFRTGFFDRPPTPPRLGKKTKRTLF